MNAPGLILIVETSGAQLRLADECSLGRAPDNSLSFTDDQMMSRRHARIQRRETAYVLSDLGTRNGTFLERAGTQMRVTEREILPGDVILVGACRIRVAAAEEPPAAQTTIGDPHLTHVPDPTRVGGILPNLGAPPEDSDPAPGPHHPNQQPPARHTWWWRPFSR